MRMRMENTVKKLDIKETVNKLTTNPAVFEPQYYKSTKPVEYLMLIDWSSSKNHKAQLFDYLYRTFISNNVYVERFYFNADPRVLWNEQYSSGTYIEELQHRYPEHILLIFSNAQTFINPYKAELENWTNFFYEWEKRALLTPVPTALWGYNELKYAELFPILLPSTSTGLKQLVEMLAITGGSQTDLKTLKYSSETREEPLFISPNKPIVPQLKQYFSDEMISWFAACALYPELYWDLTIYIGKIVAKHYNKTEDDFNNQQQINQLNRLDWFNEGKIPVNFRMQLISAQNILPANLRENVLTGIIDILEQNLPKENSEIEQSYAYQNFFMNLVVSKLLLKKTNKKERRKLKEKLKELSQTTETQDYVALKYLNKQKSKFLDFILPRKFNKFFFKNGNSVFGIKKGVTYAIYFIILLITFIFLFKQKSKNNYYNLDFDVVNYLDSNHFPLKNRGLVLLIDQNNDTLKADINEYGFARFDSILIEKKKIYEVSLIDTQYYNYYEPYKIEIYDQTIVHTTGANFSNLDTNIFKVVKLYAKVGIIWKTDTTGCFIDQRDTTKYEVVKIGNQTWMAENLAYLPEVCSSNENCGYWVYDYNGTDVNLAKNNDNYKNFGVLYNWETALKSCPDGWNLPSDAEWSELELYIGMPYNEIDITGWRGFGVGESLKSDDFWVAWKGNNKVGFNIRPAGIRSTGGFANVLHFGYYWSATQLKKGNVYWRIFSSENFWVGKHEKNIEEGFSVRCIKDNTKKNVDMVLVKGGTFNMDNSDMTISNSNDEISVHKVTVADFYIGKYEVTNEEYCAFLNDYEL